MNFSSLTSLFTRSTQKLAVPDTMLVKKLKTLSNHSNLKIFKDVNIYYHAKIYTIPLIMLDDTRGLYLFETKEWPYDELKSSTISKAQNQSASKETLAFDNTQDIIRQKFNELTHSDGVPIYNYLLMENLNTEEYEHLSEEFKSLLPLEKIIFSDSDDATIFKKLQEASDEKSLLSSDKVLSTLFIQYGIITPQMNYFANEQQREFIDKELKSVNTLTGNYASGKSSLILLKSILELLNNPNKTILILKPTRLACDLFKRQLLEIVENAIVEIDLTAIEIITPLELLNKTQIKLKHKPLTSLEIDDKLLSKATSSWDLLICDDAQLYEDSFIDFLKHIQKKAQTLLVLAKDEENIDLAHNYRLQNRAVHFHKTNPYAKTLSLLFSLVQREKDEIVVVCAPQTAQKLQEDLEKFILQIPHILDADAQLINQKREKLIFASYDKINELHGDNLILLDLGFTSLNEIEYALNLATKSAYLLYEEETQDTQNLRIKYEKSSKD